ncbi:carboxypeptidase-like regulatory domain-containing protein [Niabella hibiscisoli]|uniref:carboxypeptidase-like regulatory domain-containing protein n=1 Tax=Niabella hibiscisoli TaxID=1825928 RepID=UPI001F10604F|nr:carboxypeptidase-like regulatory domain-containing protein [Niabella hibiscisoli]MCH5719939.1 carboxypeptidase-like regulatory domain-containing protein [Niabella hibiscisoli]
MIKYIFTGIAYLLLSGALMAQTTISGVVTDGATKRPISGVSLRSASGVTVQTNKEGQFAINISKFPDTLYITHVGFMSYKTQVNGSQTYYNFELAQRESELEEVLVNTGYQKIKPNEINGSVTVIDNKMLNQQTGTNILQRLNGVTNGLIFNIGKRGSSAVALFPTIFPSGGSVLLMVR